MSLLLLVLLLDFRYIVTPLRIFWFTLLHICTAYQINLLFVFIIRVKINLNFLGVIRYHIFFYLLRLPLYFIQNARCTFSSLVSYIRANALISFDSCLNHMEMYPRMCQVAHMVIYDWLISFRCWLFWRFRVFFSVWIFTLYL